jgi:alpha-glucosidase
MTELPTAPNQHRWPEGAFVYQIYPRSFQDSNGDGVGDLPGIIGRLDHLVDLGVTAIWLSPFYPSPMADFGYDVADYCDVDPIFGTLDDFKQLLQAVHDRDMRMMIDLVPNHTSDDHEWFKQSRTSRDNPYHDWYIWRDGIDIGDGNRPAPPNNWRDALTGGPAWEWVEERGQYYLHSFDVRQPDLDWANQAVREAIKDAMRFWLDIGVDGFRVDAVYWMAKEPLLSDDPHNLDFVEGEDLPYHALRHDNSRGWPAVYAYLSEMAEVLHEPAYKDRQPFMVTEAYPEGHNPLVEYLNFYVGIDPLVAAPFNFEGLSMPWEAGPWRKFLRSFHGALSQIDPACVPSYAFGNHDQPRIMTRRGEPAARAAAVLLMTLPGMVFVYYGDEIGMKNVSIPPAMVQDPGAKGDVQRGETHPQGRDPERTPMQWSAEPQAGFSTSRNTWLPLDPDHETLNVESEKSDDGSLLTLYEILGTLRKRSTALKYGELHVIETAEPSVLGFIRTCPADDTEGQDYVTLVNFSAETVTCSLSHDLKETIASSDRKSAMTSVRDLKAGAELSLRPYEAVLLAAA